MHMVANVYYIPIHIKVYTHTHTRVLVSLHQVPVALYSSAQMAMWAGGTGFYIVHY